MNGKNFKILEGDISDGYHTFSELYEHRTLLFLALCLMRRKDVVWRPHYEGWPVVYLKTNLGQISYHVPERFQIVLEHNFIRDDTFEWDGHTPDRSLERLELLIGGLHSVQPVEEILKSHASIEAWLEKTQKELDLAAAKEAGIREGFEAGQESACWDGAGSIYFEPQTVEDYLKSKA